MWGSDGDRRVPQRAPPLDGVGERLHELLEAQKHHDAATARRARASQRSRAGPRPRADGVDAAAPQHAGSASSRPPCGPACASSSSTASSSRFDRVPFSPVWNQPVSYDAFPRRAGPKFGFHTGGTARAARRAATVGTSGAAAFFGASAATARRRGEDRRDFGSRLYRLGRRRRGRHVLVDDHGRLFVDGRAGSRRRGCRLSISRRRRSVARRVAARSSQGSAPLASASRPWRRRQNLRVPASALESASLACFLGAAKNDGPVTMSGSRSAGASDTQPTVGPRSLARIPKHAPRRRACRPGLPPAAQRGAGAAASRPPRRPLSCFRGASRPPGAFQQDFLYMAA